MSLPIISLEVQGMKHTMKMMLAKEAALLDASLQRAVEEFCTEENLNNIVRKEAMRQLEEAVKQEVRNFFSFNAAGRLAVREAVHEFLEDRYPIKEGGT